MAARFVVLSERVFVGVSLRPTSRAYLDGERSLTGAALMLDHFTFECDGDVGLFDFYECLFV